MILLVSGPFCSLQYDLPAANLLFALGSARTLPEGESRGIHQLQSAHLVALLRFRVWACERFD